MPKVRLIAASQLLLAVLLQLGIWIGLPARWPWVDVPGTLLGVACAVVGVALWLSARWAVAAARWLLWLELGLGTLTVSLLAVSAAQLVGSYGPVGSGGAVLMVVICLLVLPYLVVFPALQLALIGWAVAGPRVRGGAEPSARSGQTARPENKGTGPGSSRARNRWSRKPAQPQ